MDPMDPMDPMHPTDNTDNTDNTHAHVEHHEHHEDQDTDEDIWVDSEPKSEDLQKENALRRQRRQELAEELAEEKLRQHRNALCLYVPVVREALQLTLGSTTHSRLHAGLHTVHVADHSRLLEIVQSADSRDIVHWLSSLANTNMPLHHKTFVAMQKLQVDFDYALYHTQTYANSCRQRRHFQLWKKHLDGIKLRRQQQRQREQQREQREQQRQKQQMQHEVTRKRKPVHLQKTIHKTRARVGNLVVAKNFPRKISDGGSYFHIQIIHTYVGEFAYDCEGTQYSATHGISRRRMVVELDKYPHYLEVVNSKIDHDKFQRQIAQYQQQLGLQVQEQLEQQEQAEEEQMEQMDQMERQEQMEKQQQQDKQEKQDKQEYNDRRHRRRQRLLQGVGFYTAIKEEIHIRDYLEARLNNEYISKRQWQRGSFPDLDSLGPFVQFQIAQMYKQLDIPPRDKVRGRELDQGQDTYVQDLQQRKVLLEQQAQDRQRRRLQGKNKPVEYVDDYLEYLRYAESNIMTFQQYINP
tara:strand:- start:66 stop:1634 length:1569 start_codon:yes stop_codon:yes gene_type:complete